MLQARQSSIGKSTATNPVVWLYRVVTVGIFVVGAALDVVLLLFGEAPLLRFVFTPLGELVLTTWMATALVLGIVAYPRLNLHRRATRIAQGVVLFYLVALVLVHGVNNLLLGNTAAYLQTFSAPAYPYIATVVLLAGAAFTAGLEEKQSANG